ncbi:MAG: DASH family cryptochrome [Cytophagaceae bacterium]
MNTIRSLVWFRNDLRVHDHKPLYNASLHSNEVIPFYCWENRLKQTTSFGFKKLGDYRANFLYQSVLDLKQTLQKEYQSDLYFTKGDVEKELVKLYHLYPFQKIYYFIEPAPEEIQVAEKVEKAMALLGVECISYWGNTICDKDDLPFNLLHIPDTFTKFKKEVERAKPFLAPLSVPQKITIPASWKPVKILSPEELDFKPVKIDSRAAMDSIGGESEALVQLQYYVWDRQLILNYKNTRNELLGFDYSSKLSAYLSVGAISPRLIYEEVKHFEETVESNESTYWLIFELLWRDYFKFLMVKYNHKFFIETGIKEESSPSWDVDWNLFNLWKEGMTGNPFVDANMRELKYTGYMSNRGRQNVASFLCKDLNVNWLMGAQYFESMLVDYDVCSNYGNWAYIAGVGVDPRGFRYFNTFSQAEHYDRHGHYVKHWIPELAPVEEPYIHEIHKQDRKILEGFGVRLGEDYPEYILAGQKKRNAKQHV